MSVELRELELAVERLAVDVRRSLHDFEAEMRKQTRILEDIDKRHVKAAEELAEVLKEDGETSIVTRYQVGLFVAGVLATVAVLQFLGLIKVPG